MTRPVSLLIFDDAHRRIGPLLEHAGLLVDPVLVRKDGSVEHGGRTMTVAEAAPEVAWLSPDLYTAGLLQPFFDLVTSSGSVRWAQAGQAGYDHPGFAAVVRGGIRLTMSKAPAPGMAEYVLSEVLHYFQKGEARRAAQREQTWQPLGFREVAGSRWVSLGFGAIGRETALRARAFGAHVTGVRRSPGPDADADAIVAPDAMDAALAEADVVVVSTPLNAETTDSINAAFFAKLKPGVLFVNVGRGPLVVDEDLRAALDSGQVAHAILDVTRVEPLPPGEWQWTHPKVTLTAHTSGWGSGLMARTDAILVTNLGRYVRGEPLFNEVDPSEFATEAKS